MYCWDRYLNCEYAYCPRCDYFRRLEEKENDFNNHGDNTTEEQLARIPTTPAFFTRF